MSECLLDTCIIIDLLRGDARAAELVMRLQSKPFVSVVTVAEVFAGLKSQKRELIARTFFRECRILSVTAEIAEQAGNSVRHYRASHSLDIPDALIAATAEHHGLALATLNVKHFPMLDGLKRAY